MLAQNNETIGEAASTVYKLTQEERIRMECEAREDYYRTQRDMQLMMKRSTEKLEKLTAENEVLTNENEVLTNKNEVLANENDRLRQWIKAKGFDPSSI